LKALIFNIQRFSLHDGNGIRTTIFFKGCNLRCKWCANPESFSDKPEFMEDTEIGRYYTLDELMAEIIKDKPFYDKSGGGVTLSGGEPLLQAEFVCALCDALQSAGINVGIETAANVPQNVFANVLKRIDFALIDLKHWSRDMYKDGTGADNQRILDNIRYALTQEMPVTIRIPIIPGYNNAAEDAHAFAELLNQLGAKQVHILPFHQLGDNKYKKLGLPYDYSGVPQLHDEDLGSFAGILSSSGLKVQIGG
jgi:pyruvate formate lyase activating enzyme